MQTLELTERHFESAVAYLPAAQKAALAQALAELCVEAVEQNDAPPVFRLNTLTRELCAAMVLLRHYLKLLPEDENPGADFAVKDYDAYMPAVWEFESTGKRCPYHDDFRRFLDMLDACIQSELAVRNDPCTRLTAMMTQMTTPEALQQALGQMQALQEDLKNFSPVSTLQKEEFNAAAKDL